VYVRMGARKGGDAKGTAEMPHGDLPAVSQEWESPLGSR
jgi:hypothetical protein